MHPEQAEHLLAAMNHSAVRFTRAEVIRDLNQTLREIVEGAVTVIPGVTHAGITTRDAEGRLASTAPTAEVVARLDQAQAALREGPCVAAVSDSPDTEPAITADDTALTSAEQRPTDALRDAATPMVRVQDMAAEADNRGRWPRFAPEALRNGIASMLSLRLSGDRHPVRALNLYADQPAVFDTATCLTAALFADQAAIALYGAQHAAGLSQAVDSRDVIGQAKGILIERHQLTSSDDAFTMLVEASQQTNIKLRDVADWLVTSTLAGSATPSSDS